MTGPESYARPGDEWLISDGERAERVLRRLRSIDTVLVTAGELPTGLVPVATDLVNATLDTPRVYRSDTHELLESDQLDPALRERLSQSGQDDPLALADARIHDARVISFGTPAATTSRSASRVYLAKSAVNSLQAVSVASS